MVQETKHVLEVLRKAKQAIKQEDAIKLKELSNQTIHSASIEQDTDSIMIAVIIYSISKIIERTKYKDYPGWRKFFSSLMKHIDNAIAALEKNNEEIFKQEMVRIRQEVNKLSGNFKKHIQDVFHRASINKASRIYEHGISLEKTAQLLGITLWELAEYTGKTGIPDVNLAVTKPIKERIKIAEEIFGK